MKVQVQVGGRGKGGGVVLVDSPERAAEEAARMLGHRLQGAPGHAGALRGAAPDRAGVLHVDPARPVHGRLPRHDDRRGRHGHRGARPHAPRGAPPGARRRDAGDARVPRARADGVPARRGARGRRRRAPPDVRAAPGPGRDPRGDQPARAAGGRARGRARRQGHGRRQRAVPPRGHRGDEGGLPDRPRAGACERERPAVREARRERRDHRQRRGPRDVHAGRRGAGGRAGRELPGRRGRSERRPDGHVPRGRAVRSGREGRVHQHLRRHHAMRPGRRGRARRARARRGRRPAGGPAGRDERRGGPADPRRGRAPADRAGRDDAGGRRARRRPRERGRRHERPGGRRHAPRRAGAHREGGHVPHPAQPGLRDPGRRGRHARQGGPGRRRASPCTTPSPTRCASTARTPR